MIAITGTIVCSALILVIFRVFEKLHIHTFHAIIANYFTAFLCGFLVHSNHISKETFSHLEWLPYVSFSALLFISLFLIMAKSSQKNGIGATAVAVKMSMAVSVLGMVLLYNEPVSIFKIGGMAFALAGVYFIAAPDKNRQNRNSTYMLIILFLGSGLLDLNLNYAQNHALDHITSSLFTAFGFGAAGTIGLFVYLVQKIRHRADPIASKSIAAGVLLGIPNYYSIYFLLESYNTSQWNDSSILAIVNVSIVLVSVLIGFIAFKEPSNTKKLFGIIASIVAILMLYIAS